MIRFHKQEIMAIRYIYDLCVKSDHSSNAATQPGPGCSKLTTSLVNVSLKFQTLIAEICQYVLLKKCEKVQKLLSFL